MTAAVGRVLTASKCRRPRLRGTATSFGVTPSSLLQRGRARRRTASPPPPPVAQPHPPDPRTAGAPGVKEDGVYRAVPPPQAHGQRRRCDRMGGGAVVLTSPQTPGGRCGQRGSL